MSADNRIKSFVDRVLRLKEEQDALGQDIRDIYAEAKSEGYDKTTMGKVVAHLRKVLKEGEPAVSEQENVFDIYLQAYHRASGTRVATHTHEEEFDPITGEFRDEPVNAKLVKQVVEGMQTEGGRAALITAVDILIAREEADESPSADIRAEGREVVSDSSLYEPDEGAIAAVKAQSRLANVADVEPSSSVHTPDQHLAGGDHVTAQPAATHQAEAIVKSASATKPLRPLCRNPGEHCGGYGSTHCGSCLRASKEEEVA